MKPLPLLCLLLLAVAIGSCRDDESSPVETAAPLTERDLLNGTYRSDVLPAGSVTLQDGFYENEDDHLMVHLSEIRGFGDLNGDGSEDAVVILVSNLGGTGTFHELAVVLNQDGIPTHTASTLLGDRVEVRNLAVVGSEIVVDLITHGENDPLCCPSEEITERYRLENGRITHLETEESPSQAVI